MTAEEYFGSSGFERLMDLCRDKYISLSHIGGSVILKNVSDEERSAIGGLLGRVYEGSDIKAALKEIDKALLNSRFHVSLEELLKQYFKDELITRSDRLTAEKKEKEKFFNDICGEYTGGTAADWLQYMLTKKNVFAKRYNEDRELLKHDIAIVCRALGKLGKPQLLPVFAAEVSDDPHMLDDGTSCGQLFNYAIMYLTGTEQLKGTSGRSELLEKAGLYSDMVSSFVYCRNIRLYDSTGEHPAYKAYLERNEAFTLNIGNLTDIVRAKAQNDTVYIVENPAVFTALAQRTEDVSLICTAGQPKGACIRLLDLSGNTRMYYSGDFDMGGINIAQRLFSMFKNMRPWHFGPEDYISALSDKPLSETAVRSLHGMQNGCFGETVRLMLKTGLAGYQENILEILIKDIITRRNNKMTDAISTLKSRRSCRKFDGRPVTEEQLNIILEAGMYAPTGMGRQSPIMVAVQDKETIAQLSKMNAAIMGSTSDPFYGASTVIIVLANKNMSTYLYDGSLVMGNLMNAAEAIGIQSCWIHRAKEEFESEEGRALLKKWGIDGDYEGIGHCVLGYGEKAPLKPRKDNYIYRV